MQETRNRVEDLKTMFLQEGIQFSDAKGWEALADHVEVHKYYLSKELDMNITWDEALFSWYENVLTPLRRVVDTWEIKVAFPNRTFGDLYLAISDHWFYLKENDTEVGADEAAVSFVQHYGEGLGRFFSRFLIPAPVRRELKLNK